jgi:16S rRNA (cytosine1402-N4)-methyltransferase
VAAHVSVLLPEALERLDVRPGGTYVDATFGAGGHATGIALRLGRGRLVALDADPDSVMPEHFPASTDLRFELVHANFRDLRRVLDERGIERIDGILYDLGVSSMQLDRPERGFSFREDAPLDMRLDPSSGRSAAELLHETGERELADIIYEFGEERAARQIARALVARRREGRLPQSTGELARLVAGVVHVRGKRERIHPATRTFQALRIAVNDELGALRASLDAAFDVLAPGGRVVVISFHSLEDRIVKQTFRDDDRVTPVTRKPITPALTEITHNPRARSARLRAAERVAA